MSRRTAAAVQGDPAGDERAAEAALDVKSFSHELNMRGPLLHRLQQRKPRGCVNSPEEFIGAIRTKFIRLKEEVDAELGVFAGDLVGTLDKADGGEERVVLEDLLVVAQRCAKMSPEEPRRCLPAPPLACRCRRSACLQPHAAAAPLEMTAGVWTLPDQTGPSSGSGQATAIHSTPP
uniref:IREH1/IRE-like N-terminal domain-containing protein n=1 Tax=Oryza barthii TaxID=65489 RepID=A0A0D3HFI2_9ORYZ